MGFACQELLLFFMDPSDHPSEAWGQQSRGWAVAVPQFPQEKRKQLRPGATSGGPPAAAPAPERLPQGLGRLAPCYPRD